MTVKCTKMDCEFGRTLVITAPDVSKKQPGLGVSMEFVAKRFASLGNW